MKTISVVAVLLGAVHYTVATEAVYLANCYDPAGYGFSEFDYYNQISNSHNGQHPDDNSARAGNGDSIVTWEQYNQGTYNSGVTFQSWINGDAQSYSTGQYAGHGTNGYSNFNCYKDNGRFLYNQSPGPDYNCYSIYYCKQD